MAKSQKVKGGNSKKRGRSKRKAEGKNKPFARYVRGEITFEQFTKLTSAKRKA